MSQLHAIKIEALEAELKAVKARLDLLEASQSEVGKPKGGFYAKHFGFGKDRWKVLSPDDVPTGTEWLSREDAEALAVEQNAALEGMEAA